MPWAHQRVQHLRFHSGGAVVAHVMDPTTVQEADVSHLLPTLGFLSAAKAAGSPLRRWRFAAEAAVMLRPSWRSSFAAALRCTPHGLRVRV